MSASSSSVASGTAMLATALAAAALPPPAATKAFSSDDQFSLNWRSKERRSASASEISRGSETRWNEVAAIAASLAERRSKGTIATERRDRQKSAVSDRPPLGRRCSVAPLRAAKQAARGSDLQLVAGLAVPPARGVEQQLLVSNLCMRAL
eukprot:scaffold274186_cov28-Tisochrysis_lutea.AAC.2